MNVLATIALARLLFPEDYGLFAITMLITGLGNLFSHFGFQSYIIQAPELTAETLNTCYTLNVALALLMGLRVKAIWWRKRA